MSATSLKKKTMPNFDQSRKTPTSRSPAFDTRQRSISNNKKTNPHELSRSSHPETRENKARNKFDSEMDAM